MAPNFDYDLLEEIVNQAPSAGFGPRVNYGKFSMSEPLDVTHWDNAVRKFVTRPWDGKPLNQSKREYFQITFKGDLAAINPTLTREYKRRVDIKRTSDKGKKNEVLTDWSETVEPALIKHLGKGWAKALSKGIWAEWEDVETVEKNKEGQLKGYTPKDESGAEKTGESGQPLYYINTVPRLVRVFKSKAECEAARAERFAKNDADALAFGDDGVSIPDKVVSDVKGILQALDGDQLITLLSENEPYKSYDLVALLTAAGADEDVIALASE